MSKNVGEPPRGFSKRRKMDIGEPSGESRISLGHVALVIAVVAVAALALMNLTAANIGHPASSKPTLKTA